MNELMLFENIEFGTLRSIIINEIPWFVGKDVAISLGYKNTNDAISKHVDGEDKIMGSRNVTPYVLDSKNRKQYPTLINESGLYSLIFGSDLEAAKRFKRWVTSEVLPSIRKTGSYTYKQAQRPQYPGFPSKHPWLIEMEDNFKFLCNAYEFDRRKLYHKILEDINKLEFPYFYPHPHNQLR